MVEVAVEESADRLVITFDPGGPVALQDLTETFAGIARLYERHYRAPEDQAPAPKLYVTRLESGSIIAEIAPLGMFMGSMIAAMGGMNTVANFSKRLSDGIRAFADIKPSRAEPPRSPPSREDAADLRAFIAPLTGKNGASLGIRHARYTSVTDQRTIVAEYDFDEAAINRAFINIDRALSLPEALPGAPLPLPGRDSILQEVMLILHQASRGPGKDQGRTGDKGIVSQVTDKPLPVYFRESFQNIKDQMVRGQENPLTCGFVVDVSVQYVGPEPKAYIVTDLHSVVPLDDDNGPGGG